MGVLSMRMKSLYGITISEQQENLLLNDLRSVLESNKKVNLTGVVSEEEGLIIHLEDSLSGLPYLQNAPDGLYGDLGTGGGFPGIPLCIMSGRKTVLIDSIRKKTKILEHLVEDLRLKKTVDIYTGRAEDLALEYNEKFSVVTARALGSLSSVLELACPLLRVKGRLLCYKAQPSEEELSMASSIEGLLEMKRIVSDSFHLSDGSQRCIFVYEKTGQPHITLPRRVGMAQKSPLKRPV